MRENGSVYLREGEGYLREDTIEILVVSPGEN